MKKGFNISKYKSQLNKVTKYTDIHPFQIVNARTQNYLKYSSDSSDSCTWWRPKSSVTILFLLNLENIKSYTSINSQPELFTLTNHTAN